MLHTLMRSLPVPRMKPASVFPMPVANWPKAPALQVWESVPNSTSPAGQIRMFAHLFYLYGLM